MTLPSPPTNKNMPTDEGGKEHLQKQQDVNAVAKIEMTNAATMPLDKLLYCQTDKTDLIVKWVDFTSKYGLGYKLSNNSYGVLFNDSTKIILDPNHFHFDYIQRGSHSSEDEVMHLDFFNYPKTLHKKVILMQHFKSYLDGNQKFKPLEFKFG